MNVFMRRRRAEMRRAEWEWGVDSDGVAAVNNDRMDVYLDSAPENITPELALRAECVLEK